MIKPISRRTKCANLGIPDSVTPQLLQRIKDFPSDAKSDYLKEVFLSKFVSPDTDPASLRVSRAVDKWLATEEKNAATNERICNVHPGYTILPDVRYDRFVEWTRRFIETIIGPVPPVDALVGAFSGGASTSRGRNSSNPAAKYYGKAHATSSAKALFMDIVVDEVPGWSYLMNGVPHPRYARAAWWAPAEKRKAHWWITPPLEVVEVPGNVMFTVPKNAEIDRCACKEPDVNMYIQKGVGSYLRRRLLRHGINLNDQSINRFLAREGSVSGSLATLDLSSASDSVSYGLVEELLPPVWFVLMADLRSSVTDVIGHGLHRNEMFSSMGNGFTFELESLLFFALAKATAYFTGTSGVISVYGDDLIVPTPMTQDLIWVLSYFGFSVNSAKSFWDGSFRESCGGHYYGGLDITPFYLRAPMGVLTDVIHMANSLRKWSLTNIDINTDYTFETWNWLKSYVPEKYWGGRDYDNKHRLVTQDEPRYQLVGERSVFCNRTGGYIHWLNSTHRRGSFNGDPVETSTRTEVANKYRCRRVTEVTTRLVDSYLEEL